MVEVRILNSKMELQKPGPCHLNLSIWVTFELIYLDGQCDVKGLPIQIHGPSPKYVELVSYAHSIRQNVLKISTTTTTA